MNYFIQPFIHPFFHTTIHSSILPFNHSFIHSSIHPFIHPFIHSSIHSSIHPGSEGCIVPEACDRGQERQPHGGGQQRYLRLQLQEQIYKHWTGHYSSMCRQFCIGSRTPDLESDLFSKKFRFFCNFSFKVDTRFLLEDHT